MPLTSAHLADLAAAAFAEDIPIPRAASEWSEQEAIDFFESGGQKVPVAAPKRDVQDGGRKVVVCRLKLQDVELKMTLTEKFLSKPFADVVLTPFLNAYNKRRGTCLDVSALEHVCIDGKVVATGLGEAVGVVLGGEAHRVELHALAPVASSVDSRSSADVSDAAAAPNPPSAVVERVCAAADEFAVLELPREAVSVASIRRAYRRISLLVHPDKVNHPRASEAFRRAFDAMQLLIEPSRQAARLKQLSGEQIELPPETRWWEGASVHEMEQAFHNLEEFLEARGHFGESSIEDHMWTDPLPAERLRRSELAFFVDSRDTSDFETSHVKGALSLPGHTMEQLNDLLIHPTVLALASSPASIVIVYSDNGSRLSRCGNVSAILRKAIQPERVRRLRGGLNGWKKGGMPVDGDERLFFAGRAMSVEGMLGTSMAGMDLR
jgi:rhodanese-related sulfurtransferase